MKSDNLVYVWDLKEIWWVCRNRWNRCVEWTNKKMGMAVGALFIRDNFNHESKVRLLAKMHCHFDRKSSSKTQKTNFWVFSFCFIFHPHSNFGAKIKTLWVLKVWIFAPKFSLWWISKVWIFAPKFNFYGF